MGDQINCEKVGMCKLIESDESRILQYSLRRPCPNRVIVMVGLYLLKYSGKPRYNVLGANVGCDLRNSGPSYSQRYVQQCLCASSRASFLPTSSDPSFATNRIIGLPLNMPG